MRGWLAFLLLLLLVIGDLVASAVEEEPQSWPQPAQLTGGACGEEGGGLLALAGSQLNVTVLAGNVSAAEAYVQAAFQSAVREWGCETAAADPGGNAATATIQVIIEDAACTEPACYTHESDESYSLVVDTDGIIITAPAIFGANWALSTLTSLADSRCALGCLPIQVEDAPRFPHRGLMLDTARNWFSVEDIKRKVLDPMHAVKLNVLHWHIYDSQSQPLEVRFNPALWLPYSEQQRYSQDDAREIVRYAFSRGIRVLPEFDMPGHTAIFAKAYPELVACAGYVPWDGIGWPDVMANQPPAGQLRPEGVGVATQLLREMAGLFPNSIISTGADEVNFNCWNNATVVPQKSKGYPAFREKWVAALAGFQEKVAATITAAGRTMAVWDESFGDWGFAGTPALPNGSVLLSWQYADRAAEMTDAGYNVVWCPWRQLYLDCGLGTRDGPPNWCAPLNSWQTIYAADPLEGGGFSDTAGDPSRLLGAEVLAWSEQLRPAVLDYVVWPRAAALAEKLWSRAVDTQDPEAAKGRLQRLARQLEARGLRPSPLEWDGQTFKYQLLPQWCDAAPPQTDSEGTDYCAPAAAYRGVDLTAFENLVGATY